LVIRLKKSSLWSEPVYIVNPVNCVGVMGAGIALEFRKSFPIMYELYKIVCSRKLLWPGDLLTYHADRRVVINVATKGHFKYPSHLSYIKDIVSNLNSIYPDNQTTIGMPKIGAGHGGLEWRLVQYQLQEALCNINVYTGKFEAQLQSEGFPHMTLVSKGKQYPTVLSKEDYYATQDHVDSLQSDRIYSNKR
jgi:O-acetyl-ADP-ribose deacetylase (regulator of RNase III)